MNRTDEIKLTRSDKDIDYLIGKIERLESSLNILDSLQSTGLYKAYKAVYSDREEDYGPPSLNHNRTAELWNVWLNLRFGGDIELTSEDVCFLNILQKMSREIENIDNTNYDDNLIDIQGYAENVLRIRNENLVYEDSHINLFYEDSHIPVDDEKE